MLFQRRDVASAACKWRARGPDSRSCARLYRKPGQWNTKAGEIEFQPDGSICDDPSSQSAQKGSRTDAAPGRAAPTASVVTIALLTLTAMLGAISVVDFRTYRIPDWLSLPLILGGLFWSCLYGKQPFSAHLAGAAIGYLSLAAFGWLYFRLFGREGLGLGDAKLFAAGGAWLGWQDLPFVLLAAAVCGLIYAVVTGGIEQGRRGTKVAFGPWLSVAIWMMWLIENVLE